jgi:alkanesulfonate monooxygenase SsuD/methylene tetrahydromethanopterin reductase-like flavin-dependent oxidoreductase (luciferase family)
MDVGIGLPNAVAGVDRAGTVDWARRAEAAGFASLGTIGRILYPNYEELISLAAAAAVTERIRLVTDILLAPLRTNTALFAKQTATLDSLSNGRLVLGLAPGGREDDYEVSRVDFGERGKIFERQLEELPKLWAGDEVGPRPATGDRPRLLIGAMSMPLCGAPLGTRTAGRRAAARPTPSLREPPGWTSCGRPRDATAAPTRWPSSISGWARMRRSMRARTSPTTTPGWARRWPIRSSPALPPMQTPSRATSRPSSRRARTR